MVVKVLGFKDKLNKNNSAEEIFKGQTTRKGNLQQKTEKNMCFRAKLEPKSYKRLRNRFRAFSERIDKRWLKISGIDNLTCDEKF